jgi:hypothetical protein
MSGNLAEPDSQSARTGADFVAAMRRLKAWSDLSYRELGKRAAAAGDVLPHSTIAAALSRDRLPREDVVAAFVRACGCDVETVQTWLAVRRRLAADDPAWSEPRESGADEPAEVPPRTGKATGPERAGRSPAAWFRRRPVLPAVAAVAVAAVALAIPVAHRLDGSGRPGTVTHSPSSTGPLSGPVARWRFDERTGTTVADAAGHGFPLRISGSTSRIAAAGGMALKLDGAGYASTARPVVHTDGAFTIAAWARLDSAGDWGTLISQHDVRYDLFLLDYDKDADRWAFMTPDDAGGKPTATALSAAPPRLGTWTHLAAVYDGAGGLGLYVDGRLEGKATAPRIHRATGVMDVGRALYSGSAVDLFRGAVDEVSVYARALSAAELGTVARSRL